MAKQEAPQQKLSGRPPVVKNDTLTDSDTGRKYLPLLESRGDTITKYDRHVTVSRTNPGGLTTKIADALRDVTPESPVSNKNQSSPGKTSGGFSYKLKND